MILTDFIKLILGEQLMDYLRAWRYPYRSLSDKKRDTPVDPWAFIRVKNEIRTIEASLNSILPAIKKGVIGYNPSDDGTDEFIKDFCQRNSGFIPFKYDHPIVPACDIRYKDIDNIAPEERLDSYYNAVLEKIPDGEWLIKIDCDHIYDSEKLKQLFYLPENDDEFILISRINLHCNKEDVFLITENPFYYGNDHWLIRKTPQLRFQMFSGFGRSNFTGKNQFFAWEGLPLSHLKGFRTDLLTWHFPLIKSRRNIPISRQDSWEKSVERFSRNIYHISPDMLDKQRILTLTKGFHLPENT